MSDLTISQLAVRFVDQLVPGHFQDAGRMLDRSCVYVFAGETLRGEAIIGAFEKSDAEAHRKFDAVEYLPGRVAETHGTTVVVQVFDRLVLAGRTHTYTDRLAVTIDPERSGKAKQSRFCAEGGRAVVRRGAFGARRSPGGSRTAIFCARGRRWASGLAIAVP